MMLSELCIHVRAPRYGRPIEERPRRCANADQGPDRAAVGLLWLVGTLPIAARWRASALRLVRA